MQLFMQTAQRCQGNAIVKKGFSPVRAEAAAEQTAAAAKAAAAEAVDEATAAKASNEAAAMKEAEEAAATVLAAGKAAEEAARKYPLPYLVTDQLNERVAKLEQVFAAFDLDDSGAIDSKELMQLGKAKDDVVLEKVWDDVGMSGVWDEQKNAALFCQMDLNQDGKIAKAEFTQHFEAALTKDMEKFEIAVQIFLQTAEKCRSEVKEERISKLTEVFAVFDLDNSGAIDSPELLELGRTKGKTGETVWDNVGMDGVWDEEKNARLFYQMDLDQDGKISRAEFVTHFEPALPKNMTAFDLAIQVFMETARKCHSAGKAAFRELQNQALELGCDSRDVNMAFDSNELQQVINACLEARGESALAAAPTSPICERIGI